MATHVDQELDHDKHRFTGYDDQVEFRSVSRAAVASIVFAVLGLSGLLIQPFLGLLLFGIAAGVVGLVSTIRYPEEITGRPIAIIGIVLCSTLFLTMVAWNTYDYMTEVPEGYQRVTWRELQPPKEDKQKVVSDRSLDLNGDPVFVEGYVMLPTKKNTELKSFILVRDIGACCFGDADPKPTHIIRVDMPPGQTVDWSTRPRKLTGVFIVDRNQRAGVEGFKGVEGVYYSLEADSHK